MASFVLRTKEHVVSAAILISFMGRSQQSGSGPSEKNPNRLEDN